MRTQSKDHQSVVLLLGTGARALHAAMALERSGTAIGGLLAEETQPSSNIGELPVLGICSLEDIETQWLDQDVSFFVAVARPRLYESLCQQLYKRLCNAIDPSAVLASDLHIGRNVLIEAGALLGPQLHIEDNCWIQPHARLAAGVTLNTGAIVGAGATLSEGVRVDETAYIGPQSYLAAGLHIGRDAQIAPLSRILKDIPAHACVKGHSEHLT